MKTKSFHHSNLGRFAPPAVVDSDGYITVHDSPRYAGASAEQLETWLHSRLRLVRAAASVEMASRRLARWLCGAED